MERKMAGDADRGLVC